MEKIMLLCSTEDLKQIVIESLKEYEAEKDAKSSKETYSINKVAKILRRSHATISKLISEGVLKTTVDQRRVTSISLNNYLKENMSAK